MSFMLPALVNLFELIKKHFPNTGEATSERLLEVFMDYVMELNLELYPAQAPSHTRFVQDFR